VNNLSDATPSAFERAIEATHGAKSRLLGKERVDEVFVGTSAWNGEVLVFELLDHPSATRCYAWEVDGEVKAVLGGGTVDSAIAAVRAFILATDFLARSKAKRR
jgi:hypothetical protein